MARVLVVPWSIAATKSANCVLLVRAVRRTKRTGPVIRRSGTVGVGGRAPGPCRWACGTKRRSEEAESLARVAHQQVLGLLVVVQHHQVVLAPDAGLLVAAERRMRGVLVVAVRP